MSKKNNRAVCGCAATERDEKSTRAGVRSFRLHLTKNARTRQHLENLALQAEAIAHRAPLSQRPKFWRLVFFLREVLQ